MSKAKNILFIDEDKIQLETLAESINATQHNIMGSYASTPEEVMQQLKTRPFDVVTSDLGMKGFPAECMLKEIKKYQPGALRFIISSSITDENCLEYVNHAHQFISKPCSASKIINKIHKSFRLKNILLNEQAAKAIASIRELPSMPDLYFKLEQALRKEDVVVSDIGKLIGEDVSMTASLLKLVNSPFFGLYSKVTKPEQAVTLLGLGTIKGLVLGMYLFSHKTKHELNFSIEKLAEHSQYTARLARTIARKEGCSMDITENAFLAGFIHDIGKLVLTTSFPQSYGTILSMIDGTDIPIQDAERDVLGYTHAEVGAYLLAIWGFHEDVVEAVYCHHDLSKLGCTDLSPAVTVHVANSFDHELRASREEGEENSDHQPHILNADWLEENGFADKLIPWLEICAEKMEETL